MGDSLGLNDFSNGVNLFGPLLADKPPNIGVVIRMLTSAWVAFGEVQIVDVKDLIFSIKVQHKEAARRIVDEGPWIIFGFAFNVQYWPLHLAIEELDPKLIYFWLCFNYGRLGHRVEQCHFEGPVDDGDGLNPYGHWLKARFSHDLDVHTPTQTMSMIRRRTVATKRTVGAPPATEGLVGFTTFDSHAPLARGRSLDREDL
ncbi:uncharacterized protein Pyn_19026 [Prunus yedoensis var. nudiflora]|uniref:DUF4283 domain-containing protein n=1 Tax=Prunus yedoensis var. nudiflora TaxID=2094558 RepID=A0A314ZBK8_PRUYE|nr:uncharacterized protein Pyn_19026 [Prunus yedoensis var. nudiflora]